MISNNSNSALAEKEMFSFFNNEETKSNTKTKFWRILVVDDEREVHDITKIVLKDLSFDGISIEFLHAYSASEAKRIMETENDISLILLDVVMEEDNSGLDLIKYIRNDLRNFLVRIILRTGQPGQAPEEKVIVEYDINDYKEKTELTARKLFNSVVTALRSYRDMVILDNSRRGLEKIISSASTLFKSQSFNVFVTGILIQMTALMNLDKNAIYSNAIGVTATRKNDDFIIVAATGDYSDSINKKIEEVLPRESFDHLIKAIKNKHSFFDNKYIIAYFESKMGAENVVFMNCMKPLNEWEKDIIKIFCSNISTAFDNIYLAEEIELTQKEIIFTLGEIAEARSKETGNHVKRVAEYSKLIALKCGIPEQEAELIRLASPMHDVGKLAIPDEILNKPAKLTDEEFEVIKGHSKIGYEMLKNSNRTIMKTAAIIALQHHEKYNGRGYPNGLKGEEIHVYGRISAIADVFDALGSDRVYKKAWELERILDLFKKERGEHFDPELVDIFIKNLDEILIIRDAFEDKMSE